ncbi:MAG: HutD family protein [Planctomycetes bacterium]|nr:HutD family protein [Planctomycetota bacterium]
MTGRRGGAAFEVVRRAAQPVVPWANGGGTTRQVAIDPPDATVQGGFRWRVSQAEVGSDGPFSRLPGVDRSLWLVCGPGMCLEVEGREVLLDRPWQRFDFAGETSIHARLCGGPCHDLNVMSARDRVRATSAVWSVATGQAVVAAEATLVLVLEGALGWQAALTSERLGAGDAVRALTGPLPCLTAVEPARVLVATFVSRDGGWP